MPDNKTVETAWRYYKHADDLQHRRHQLFLTVQGVLVAGFIASRTDAPAIAVICSVTGIGFVGVWALLVHSVQQGMDGLHAEVRKDPVYEEYFRNVRARPLLSGRQVLNVYVPFLVFIVWLGLLASHFASLLGRDASASSNEGIGVVPEWSVRWLGTTVWSWPPSDIPMFWVTLLAALVAVGYAILTSRLVKTTNRGVENAWKASQAGLLKQVLEEYTAMTPDIEKVHQWWNRDAHTAIDRYEQSLRAPHRPNEATEMGDSRRRVSQYFLRVRALCEKRMLDPELIAATLGAEPVQMFLLYIDPLDEVVRRVADKPHNTVERDYFTSYMKRHFSQVSDDDPWRLRRQGDQSVVATTDS